MRTEQGDRATTKLEISFVPLPPKPGRNTILIPSLPLSIARASGDVLVLCTSPHEVTIEDPIANTSNPSPHLNPPARSQTEEWTALKNGLVVGGLALLLGALVAWLIGRNGCAVRGRCRRPPPPRPPWEVALEELFDVRHAGLIAEGRLAEHFDRVSDTLRKYLGARFGFDGLESTTRRGALSVLRTVTPSVTPLDAIETFFAASRPRQVREDGANRRGRRARARAREHIVQETLPTAPPGAPMPGASPLEAPPPEASTPGASPPGTPGAPMPGAPAAGTAPPTPSAATASPEQSDRSPRVGTEAHRPEPKP